MFSGDARTRTPPSAPQPVPHAATEGRAALGSLGSNASADRVGDRQDNGLRRTPFPHRTPFLALRLRTQGRRATLGPQHTYDTGQGATAAVLARSHQDRFCRRRQNSIRLALTESLKPATRGA